MRGLIVVAAILAHLPAFAEAAEPQAAQRARALFKKFDGTDRPGCSVGVMQDGHLTLAFARGMADIEGQVPLAVDTVFNVASVSKQFTAFAVLLLEQRGALRRDDPITKYVPELGDYASTVTLRHLLHHTGGLRDYGALLALEGYPMTVRTTREQAMAALVRQRAANAPPGFEYDYSNTGYFLLGVVIERVSGKSLREFMRESVFRPLGMIDSEVVDHYPDSIDALARGYSPWGERGRARYQIDESLWEQAGDGQVHTTIPDLARWERNFITGAVGGLSLIGKLVETTQLVSGERLDYAGGLAVGEYRGLRIVRHGGDWAGYRAHFARYPTERFAVAVLCNRSDVEASSYALALADTYLADRMTTTGGREPTPVIAHDSPQPSSERAPRWSPRSFDGYVGNYSSVEAQAHYGVKVRGNRLVLDTGKAVFVLQPAAPEAFEGVGLLWEDEPFTLRFGAQPAAGFLLYTSGLRGLQFARESTAP